MFINFFYALRERGLNVSLNEWLTLLEALEKNLHQCSFTGFYQLCRATLVKSETKYDKFDEAFLTFFKDVPFEGELSEELMKWLNQPSEDLKRNLEDMEKLGLPSKELQELMKQLHQRLGEQTSEHNGGSYWIGTQGTSPFGNGGEHQGGIRIGGGAGRRTAMWMAGSRTFRDFRNDNKLDTRKFQMAFRLLRQLSIQADNREKVLDVDGTIRKTCDNAGRLKIKYTTPRKNTIKVLLLMDSGGSMEPYASLCSRLFQAAVKCNYFKELHTFYFHNCIYGKVYSDPQLLSTRSMSTNAMLKKYDSSYRVILVGDASMSPDELFQKQYNWVAGTNSGTYGESGMDWMLKLKKQYSHIIWLNPDGLPTWNSSWSTTHLELAKVFDMYELTTEGLEQGMKRLMGKQRSKEIS